MKKTKNNKGITLIALIITIIVLLILAVVAINAVTGDGIIAHAKNARDDYKDAQDTENTMLGNYLVQLDNANSETIIEDEEENSETREVPDALKKYILGSELQGRALTEIMDMEEMTFLAEEATISDASSSISAYTNLVKDNNTAVFYISYNSSFYRFDVNMSTFNTVASTGVTNIGETITAASTTAPELGSEIYYDGKTWTVMYVNGTEMQIISNDALQYNESEFHLGYNDSYYSSSEPEHSWPNDVTTDLGKAIYSYNNAITTLNTVCESLVTDKSKVAKDGDKYKIRCVGSNPTNKNSESEGTYSSNLLPEAYNEVGKDTDTNFLTDYDRLICLGKIQVTNNTSYWLASRFVENYQDADTIDFSIRKNTSNNGNLWRCENGYTSANSNSQRGCLRPVVTIDTTKCTFNYDSTNQFFTIQ